MVKIELKRILIISLIKLGLLSFLISNLYAIDEYVHKTNLEYSFNIPGNNQELTLEFENESKYDFDSKDWITFEYALCLGVPLKKFFGFEVEYKYIDEKKEKDAEEIETNIYFLFPNEKFKVKDENKFSVNTRSGSWKYKNEIKIEKFLFEIIQKEIALLIEDEVSLNIDTNDWEKNKFKVGFLLGLAKILELELKYVYTENLVNDTYSDGIETELSFKF